MKTIRSVRVMAILLAMLTVCSAVLLTSCDDGKKDEEITVSSIWKTDYEAAKTLSQKTILTVDGNRLGYVSSCGHLALFRGTGAETGLTRTVIFDMAANAIIKDSETSRDLNVSFFSGNTDYTDGKTMVGYVLQETGMAEGEVISTLFDAKGMQYAVVNYQASVSTVDDLILFGDTAFRFDAEGKLVEAFKLGLKDIPTTVVGSTYRYAFDNSNNFVTIYDSSYNVVTVYEFPAGAESANAFVLADGNVLVQYSVRLLDDAKKYDYIRTDILNGMIGKFDLVTQIFNVEKKTTSDVQADFVISALDNRQNNRHFDDVYVEDINVAAINYIENDFISTTTTTVTLSNDVAVDIVLDDMFVGHHGSFVQLVADNRFAVMDVMRITLQLANEKGELLGAVDKIDNLNESFIVRGKYVYDYDLALVYTLKDTESIAYVADNALVISKTVSDVDADGNPFQVVTYSLLTETRALNQVADGKTTKWDSATKDYYCIKTAPVEGTPSYRYYSYNGTLLHESSVALNELANTEDGILFYLSVVDSATGTTNVTYYYIQK